MFDVMIYAYVIEIWYAYGIVVGNIKKMGGKFEKVWLTICLPCKFFGVGNFKIKISLHFRHPVAVFALRSAHVGNRRLGCILCFTYSL